MLEETISINKRDSIDKVYFLLAGSVQKVDEQSLDIDETLDIGVNKWKSLIGLYIKLKLYSKIPLIFVKTELQKFREKGEFKIYMSVDNNIKFLSHLKKRQVKLDDNLYVHIRKGIGSIQSNSIFGEEDLMKGGRVRRITTITKTYWWILEIQKDLYNSKIKEWVRKMKEAKAVFLYEFMPKIYEKV